MKLGHIVLVRDRASPAWIKMPLGMELGISTGNFVLNGDPARPLNFRPMFIIVIVISCTCQYFSY